MLQLRLVLLIIGAVFIVALIIFEVRRARRNRSPNKVSSVDVASAESTRHREPTMTLPDIHVRHPLTEPPVIAMGDDSMIGLRLDGEHPEHEIELDSMPMTSIDAETIEATAAFPAMIPLAPMTPESSIGVVSTAGASDLSGETLLSIEPVPGRPRPEPVIDWPEESRRRIYSVRLMSMTAERFSGRALRVALAAEGFVLGPFDIFHRPAADGRVVVSASSLTKPGTFDQLSIDTQRFLGISLFVVLPGPLAAADAVEEMFRSGRELAARLEGTLQDDHGHSVTSETVKALCDMAVRESQQ